MYNYKYIIISRDSGFIKQTGFPVSYNIQTDYIEPINSTLTIREKITFKVGDWILFRNSIEESITGHTSTPFFGVITDIEPYKREDGGVLSVTDWYEAFNDEVYSANSFNLDTYDTLENMLAQIAPSLYDQNSYGNQKQSLGLYLENVNVHTQTRSPETVRLDYSKAATDRFPYSQGNIFSIFFKKYHIAWFFDGYNIALDPSGSQSVQIILGLANRPKLYGTLTMKNNVPDVFRNFNVTDNKDQTTDKNAVVIRNDQGTNSLWYRLKNGTITNNYDTAISDGPYNWDVVLRDSYQDPKPSDNTIANDKLSMGDMNHTIKFETDINNRFLNGSSGTIWDNVNVGQYWEITDDDGTLYRTMLTGYELSSDTPYGITLIFGKTRQTFKNLIKS